MDLNCGKCHAPTDRVCHGCTNRGWSAKVSASLSVRQKGQSIKAATGEVDLTFQTEKRIHLRC